MIGSFGARGVVELLKLAWSFVAFLKTGSIFVVAADSFQLFLFFISFMTSLAHTKHKHIHNLPFALLLGLNNVYELM